MILNGRMLDEVSFPIILRSVVYLLDSIQHSNQEDARIAKERVVQFRKKHSKTVARA
jgi:hypothetical protein